MSNKGTWNNCGLTKNDQEILQDLADFAFQEQQEDNLMVAFCQVWFNGSHTRP